MFEPASRSRQRRAARRTVRNRGRLDVQRRRNDGTAQRCGSRGGKQGGSKQGGYATAVLLRGAEARLIVALKSGKERDPADVEHAVDGANQLPWVAFRRRSTHGPHSRRRATARVECCACLSQADQSTVSVATPERVRCCPEKLCITGTCLGDGLRCKGDSAGTYEATDSEGDPQAR